MLLLSSRRSLSTTFRQFSQQSPSSQHSFLSQASGKEGSQQVTQRYSPVSQQARDQIRRLLRERKQEHPLNNGNNMNAQKNAARSEAARFSVASGPLKSAAKSAATSARRSLAPELTPAQQRIRLVLWGSFFAVFSSVSLYYAYCRQIQTTPLFKGAMFTLRQDRQVRKWIGENINCDWKVLGFINHIKGRADIEFQVHGTKGPGQVQLMARRIGPDWFVQKLVVSVAGEEIVHMEPGIMNRYPAEQQ